LTLAGVLEGNVYKVEDLLVELLGHVRPGHLELEHLLGNAGAANRGPLGLVGVVQLLLCPRLPLVSVQLDDVTVVRQALDLVHGVVGIQDGKVLEGRELCGLLRWLCAEFVLQCQDEEALQFLGVVGNCERAGRHNSRKKSVEAYLSDEVDKVGRQTEGHVARVSFEVGSLQVVPSLRTLRTLGAAARFESWIAETQTAGALAEAHGGEGLELGLVEGVGEEGVGRVVGCEPLLEQEQVVDVVEDPVEVGAQQAGLNVVGSLLQIWTIGSTNHGFKIVLVH